MNLAHIQGASFIAFGDWGMDTKDFNVSTQCLYEHQPNFTVLLGDNFYDLGVASTQDPLWKLFEQIEPTSPIFYAVLGNHDYGKSIDAQSAYSFVNKKWHMPARYYMKVIPFGNTLICGVFIDSYFLDKFQLNWLNLVLSSGICQGDSVYRVVFGHYPVHTVGIFARDGIVKEHRKWVKPLLEQYRVHAYISGHEHDMQVFRSNGVQYIISGAFSDKYQGPISNGGDSTLIYRSLNLTAFAVFQLNPTKPEINYFFVDSYTGQQIYNSSIDLYSTWTSQVDSCPRFLYLCILVCLYL